MIRRNCTLKYVYAVQWQAWSHRILTAPRMRCLRSSSFKKYSFCMHAQLSQSITALGLSIVWFWLLPRRTSQVPARLVVSRKNNFPLFFTNGRNFIFGRTTYCYAFPTDRSCAQLHFALFQHWNPNISCTKMNAPVRLRSLNILQERPCFKSAKKAVST